MCGICGVVQIAGTPRRVIEEDMLEYMTDTMRHRGPDDRGFYFGDGAAIGARRLSIVDVDGGHQPFSNETKTIWAAQNGELYNHADLRASLERDGHRFASRCDTEVIPHLYERHGISFMDSLRGMFGLIVWDENNRRAVLVRDRLGIKPLYYSRQGDLLVFGSELKSVLASGLVPIRVDVEAIDAYLTLGFVPGPRSPIDGVFKLMPGECLIVEKGVLRKTRYWRYPVPSPGLRSPGIDHYAEKLLELLEESVRLRLMSDVPLGAMLSGGLDSSLIVAMMARNSTGPVETFSIAFHEAGDANELADARLVAQAFGTSHHELELSYAESDVDLAGLAWHLDEPLADLSSLGFLALSDLAARHVTVALSGQGADELLGGYRKHRAAAICAQWERLPSWIRVGSDSLLSRAPKRFDRTLRTLAAPDPARRLLAMSGKFDEDLRTTLARGPLAESRGRPALAAVQAALSGVKASPLATTLYLDAQLGLVDDMLHYFDRTSMAHSLEVRVPFLDHHLVEFAATIPEAFKVRRLETKAILRRLARGVVPDRVIDKPKKGFFRQGVGGWFREQTSGVISEYLLQPDPLYADFLDRKTVARLVVEHERSSGDTEHQQLLLAVLMLEVWLATYLPRFTPSPRRERSPVLS